MEAFIKPLIVIVGQTASGKSDLAVDLAVKFNGEIICVDSRTIYKGMDIGTSKPDLDLQKKVPHHLLDIVHPDEEFTAADMKIRANQSIKNIEMTGKVPFLVGGTGLYINSIIYDFKFGARKDKKTRQKLESLTDAQLASQAKNMGIRQKDVNFLNRRHLIRAIERGGMIKDASKLRQDCIVIGIEIDSNILKTRISERIDQMIDLGLEDEAKNLAEKYGFDVPGMNAIGYKEWKAYFEGEQSIDDVRQSMYKNTWQYARRQKTWFKRDKNINWITSVDEAVRLVEQFLIQ